MTEAMTVMTTFASMADAKKMAAHLLERRLGACMQILGPIVSTYRWRDEIADDEEYLMLIKTRRDHYEALEREIKAEHPYECPEIIALPVVEASRDYLNWMDGEIGNRRK